MPRLDSLQWLRALAAMMVLIGHVIEEVAHYRGQTLSAAALPWTRGVDIFFVISGFVITLSMIRFAGSVQGAGAFLLRRTLRVVPLYWLFTTLMVLTLLIAPSGVKDTDLDPAQILSSYLFLPYERHDGRIAPVLSLGWTLNYEMFFYLLASAVLLLNWSRAVAGLLAALAFLALAGAAFDPNQTALTFWTNSIILEFGFGVLLAILWLRRGTDHVPLLAAALGFAGLAALVMLNGTTLPRAIAAGLPALLIVAGPVLFLVPPPGPLNRAGLALGDASYALYLSHRFVLRLATLALLPFLPAGAGGAFLFIVIVTLAATALSLAVFHHIERPLLAALNRRFLSAPA
jgi:peptidoglycan/LPS O-acetylase OafA/YrhL